MDREDKIKTVIYIVLFVIALTVGNIMHTTIWNNGVRKNCGGRYHYRDSYVEYLGYDRYSPVRYIFECSSCGHMIELTANPLEN